MVDATGMTGAAAAAFVSAIAWRARALSGSGAVAAAAIGAAAMFAGVSWGVLLITYFVATVGLSHWRRAEKAERSGGIVEKRGRRDATQVFANGVVFAAAALAAAAEAGGWSGSETGVVPWLAIGAGALAASAADSWATEVGIAFSTTPRSLITWRRVPAGTSGAVSFAGSLAGLGGAAFVALVAAAVASGSGLIAPIAAAGVAGTLADSLLGATVQSRRWCEACQMETEQAVHRCGRATSHRAGVRWLDNDGVNLVATIVGAAVAWAIS